MSYDYVNFIKSPYHDITIIAYFIATNQYPADRLFFGVNVVMNSFSY